MFWYKRRVEMFSGQSGELQSTVQSKRKMFTKSLLIILVFFLPFSFCGLENDGKTINFRFIPKLLTILFADKILLKDIKVITLYAGRMTNGRRSAPVPQLNCVGGTAGCDAFRPQIVQCYNRGFDGQDYQWECKTDMDNAYRFGEIAVTCEGYSYPDDPYILKGSWGVRNYC
jgi:SOCE-associated regulatory factor of calcium homoeostasis